MAGGIIYALAQINFLFDKSFELYLSADDICNYFKTKKSTTSNKARDIRKMFNLNYFDREFSTQDILASQPRFYQDPKTGLILNEDSINIFYSNDELEQLLDKASSLEGVIPKDLFNNIIIVLVTSNVFINQYDKNFSLLEADGLVFFSFFTSLEELKKIFPNVTQPASILFYDFCRSLYEYNDKIPFDKVVINPDSHQFELSCESLIEIYKIFS